MGHSLVIIGQCTTFPVDMFICYKPLKRLRFPRAPLEKPHFLSDTYLVVKSGSPHSLKFCDSGILNLLIHKELI